MVANVQKRLALNSYVCPSICTCIHAGWVPILWFVWHQKTLVGWNMVCCCIIYVYVVICVKVGQLNQWLITFQANMLLLTNWCKIRTHFIIIISDSRATRIRKFRPAWTGVFESNS